MPKLFKAHKRKIKKNRNSEVNVACEFSSNFKKRSKTDKDGRLVKVDSWEGSSVHSQTLHEIGNSIVDEIAASKSKSQTKRSKNDHKHKKKRLVNVEGSNAEEVQYEVDEENVDEISLVDKEKVDEISSIHEDCTKGMKKKLKRDRKQKQRPENVNKSNNQELQRVDIEEKVDEIPFVDEGCTRGMKKKLKRDSKQKKQLLQNVNESNNEELRRVDNEEKVDEISLVDEDCTRGMRKWLVQYKESRPGLQVLQQKIDEFVTTQEEQRDQERKEREARAAEGGWTVVVHHKGRKKTTEIETGTVVGSVASAAVIDKMSKKKEKIAVNFYKFQRREAKMNEVMMLQSKFQQDKKRIQQLRAARKFRPY